MSAPASSPAKNNTSAGSKYPSIELVKLEPKWQEGLKRFLHDLAESGDGEYFSPHPADDESVNRIAGYDGKDLYYLLVEAEKVIGYGLLRGWDEGYQIPSLGVAIHPSVRGAGLGKMFMGFLHLLASEKVRAK